GARTMSGPSKGDGPTRASRRPDAPRATSDRQARPGESAGETTSGRLKRSELEAMLSRADAGRPATRQAGAARETKGDTRGGAPPPADPQHLVGKTLGPCKVLELIG